jgi:hypothetical protein
MKSMATLSRYNGRENVNCVHLYETDGALVDLRRAHCELAKSENGVIFWSRSKIGYTQDFDGHTDKVNRAVPKAPRKVDILGERESVMEITPMRFEYGAKYAPYKVACGNYSCVESPVF